MHNEYAKWNGCRVNSVCICGWMNNMHDSIYDKSISVWWMKVESVNTKWSNIDVDNLPQSANVT